MSRRGPGRPRVIPEIRFWSKVEMTDGCWEWTDAPTAAGYGRFFDGTKKVLAHRYSWQIHGGESIAGKELDHSCLNTMCVRPEHLRVATRKENNENRSGAYSNSRSGVRGVTTSRNGRPYSAVMHHNGERHYLGRFDTLADAERAVTSKRLELFTHNEVDKANATILGMVTGTTARDAVRNMEDAVTA